MPSNKLKVMMQVVIALSSAGVVTVLHNAPASAETYTTATGGYAPTDYIAPLPAGSAAAGNLQDKSIGGQAKAQVMRQISSAATTTLQFGKIVPSVSGGSVTIAASGAINSAGGTRYIPNSGAKNATLSFAGDAGQALHIDKPNVVTLVNGENSVQISFTYDSVPSVIPNSGVVDINYGGVLNLNPDQAPGIYTGVYEFFVTYV